MTPIEFWAGCALLGLAAGVFGSALGVGSGIIMIPALVILFHFPQKSAQGTSLAVMALMAFVAAMRYWGDPAIRMDLRVVGVIAIFAMGGAVAGAGLMRVAPVGLLQKIFAAVLVVVAVRMAFFAENGKEPRNKPTSASTTQAGKGNNP